MRRALVHACTLGSRGWTGKLLGHCGWGSYVGVGDHRGRALAVVPSVLRHIPTGQDRPPVHEEEDGQWYPWPTPPLNPPSRHLTTANHCFAPPPPPARSAHRMAHARRMRSAESVRQAQTQRAAKSGQRRTVVWIRMGRGGRRSRGIQALQGRSERPEALCRKIPFSARGQTLRCLAAFPPRAAVGASTRPAMTSCDRRAES